MEQGGRSAGQNERLDSDQQFKWVKVIESPGVGGCSTSQQQALVCLTMIVIAILATSPGGREGDFMGL